MAGSQGPSPGAKGLHFLACLGASPLIGWGITAAWDAHGGLAALTIVALPAVLILGYAIWHVRRVVRTIRLRLRGARQVPDDPVAEHASQAFRTAGRVVAAVMLAGVLLARRPGLALAIALAALLFGHWLGAAARAGRLPAPEVD